MKKELVLAQSAASNNKEKAEAAAETEVSKVSAVRELLAFHQEQCKDSDTRRLDITKEIEDIDKEVREANEALASLRRNEREKSSGRSRDVSILFNAPSDDQVLLRLT
jgi:DNA repair exonuclease SbcCD nuclease subunit